MSLLPSKRQEMPKQQLLDAANANKKKYDDEVATASASRAAEGADVANVRQKDCRVQDASGRTSRSFDAAHERYCPNQCRLCSERSKLAEMKPVVEAKNQEWNSVAAKLQEAMAAKGKLDPQVEPLNSALKTATDAANASKTQLDALNGQVASLQAQATQLQADIAAFQSRQMELLQRKSTFEQSLAGLAKQMEPVEATVTATKGQADAISAEIAKLETQLAALQMQMKEQQARKATVMSDLSAKQQSLEALKTQSQQIESDAANAALQLQLFEEAYLKKP